MAVATAALIAAIALAGLPVPAGSTGPSVARDVQSAAFTSVTVSANAPALGATGIPDTAVRSDSYLEVTDRFMEPGRRPKAPATRPVVTQPASPSGAAWKPPRYTVSGNATFYGNGTTAMRLPTGTVVRVCGKGGCVQRTIDDYGPTSTNRIIDLYTPDFFKICGCPSWSGTTWVTISVY
jgi:hypothetical protein